MQILRNVPTTTVTFQSFHWRYRICNATIEIGSKHLFVEMGWCEVRKRKQENGSLTARRHTTADIHAMTIAASEASQRRGFLPSSEQQVSHYDEHTMPCTHAASEAGLGRCSLRQTGRNVREEAALTSVCNRRRCSGRVQPRAGIASYMGVLLLFFFANVVSGELAVSQGGTCAKGYTNCMPAEQIATIGALPGPESGTELPQTGFASACAFVQNPPPLNYTAPDPSSNSSNFSPYANNTQVVFANSNYNNVQIFNAVPPASPAGELSSLVTRAACDTRS